MRVPVGTDIEGGHAAGPAGIGDTVRAVLAAGAVAVNIEGGSYEPGGVPPQAAAEQTARIAAAREATDAEGGPLFVNARVNACPRGGGGVDRALERAAAFRADRADGVVVPGAVAPETVKEPVAGVDGPLNVMVFPGALTVAEPAALGVTRIGAGAALARAARALVRRAARELLGRGPTGATTGS